jgi:hypothetical protein
MQRTADYAEVVRRNHPKTTAYLLSQRDPCNAIRDEEINRINRTLVPIGKDSLADLSPPGSWLLAVILCPDDDLGPLTEWVRCLAPEDQDRIRFYAHPDVDPVEALRPWYDAGLEDPRFHTIKDWKSLHPPFGRDLNDRVYKDHQSV